MRALISPQTMRTCEQKYFQTSGVTSLEMMESAARALTDAILTRYPSARNIFIACGPGGNGGDGYACARMLREAGRSCRAFYSAPASAPDAVANASRAIASGVSVREASRAERYPAPDLWLDCLYGTGLSRAPEGDAAALIQRMNRDRALGAKLVAADIPSGLNGHSGARYEPCVRADLTVALQLSKYGHYLAHGLDLCGEIAVAPLGFPSAAFPEDLPRLVEPRDLRALFSPRARNIHKGNCGHLLIVAGSVGMAGAAALCARAALRAGAGLVSVACPEGVVPIVQTLAPCAMCVPLPQRGGALSPSALESLQAALRGKDAVVAGCGLSRRAPAEILRAVLECGLPAVIDADALNLLSEHPEYRSLLRPRHLLTPHPGEAARLLGRPCSDPVGDARALQTLGATAVLKGASRVVSGAGKTYLSASGGCGMARGGSGDIFAGLLGALLAEKSDRSYVESAAAACELHGLAGELAQKKYGPRAMNAADLLEFFPEVFARYVD